MKLNVNAHGKVEYTGTKDKCPKVEGIVEAGETKDINFDENSSVVLKIVPEDGFVIAQLIIDGDDKTDFIEEGEEADKKIYKYSIDKMSKNSKVYVRFSAKDFVAEVIDKNDSTEKKYETLKKAYDNANSRDTIRLLSNIDNDDPIFSDGDAVFGKELLIDMNGFKIKNKSTPEEFVMEKIKSIQYSNYKYQLRRMYSITYVFNQANVSGTKNNANNPSTSYFDDNLTLYNPTRTYGHFFGWYYDENFENPVPYMKTGDSGVVTSCGIYKVAAPSWPEDITLYARWKYKLTVHYNKYGSVSVDGKIWESGYSEYFDEGTRPYFEFNPFELTYRVYRVTVSYRGIDNKQKFDDIRDWTLSYWDKREGDEGYKEYGMSADTVITVTFARGNPNTGDDSNIGLWLGTMALSAAGAAVIGVLAKRRRRRGEG